MGYDTQKEIKNANNAHLRIWSTVMSQIHRQKGLNNRDFDRPSGLETRTYCGATGLTPTSLCSQDYYGNGSTTDLVASDFKGGGNGSCTLHKSVTVCRETGKLAADTCPEDQRLSIVLAVTDGGDVKGKPSTIPEGRMDVNLKETCDMQHEMPEEEVPEGAPPTDIGITPGMTPETEMEQMPPVSDVVPPAEEEESVMEEPDVDEPSEEEILWDEENFGIQ